MTDPATLIQQHAAVIITTLVDALDAPDPRDRLEAAKLLLLWGWGRPDDRRMGEADPAGGLSHADAQRAIELLRPHLRPRQKRSNRAATSCPARHEPDPLISLAAREPPAAPASPAPPGAESSRGDADPMSRRLLPSGHSADSAFYRRLPLPPPVEPPWPFTAEPRKRWPPWR